MSVCGTCGTILSDQAKPVTVAEWADEWLKTQERVVRPGTMSANRSAVRKWIVPTIGGKRLDSLMPRDVRAVAEAQEDAGHAPSSIARTDAVLKVMLKHAYLEGYQVSERARLTPGVSQGPRTRVALTTGQAEAILAEAGKRPDYSRWLAALLQGIRPGEALGLTWDMVDLEASTMTIAWQLRALPYNTPGDITGGFRVPRGFEHKHVSGAWHLVRPKTSAGVRVIPLVQALAEELGRWRRREFDPLLASGDQSGVGAWGSHLRWHDSKGVKNPDCVFCDPTRQERPGFRAGLVWPMPNGRLRTPQNDWEAWREIVDAAGVRVALPDGTTRRPLLYECRHTAATLLQAGGVDDTTIKAIIGHSTIMSTQAYLHTDLGRARAALDGSAQRMGVAA